jgi:pyridoxine 5-phosphate synthase
LQVRHIEFSWIAEYQRVNFKYYLNKTIGEGMAARLNVNIDHVATVRQARRAPEPSVVEAALMCEKAGADGITIHLRGDRRHIQDYDLYELRKVVTTYLNVEMAATEEMLKIAIDARPNAVTLVAENPNEITTEGGLDIYTNLDQVRDTVNGLKENGIMVSIFIDPDARQIEASKESGAEQVELCTAAYAEATLHLGKDGAKDSAAIELKRLETAASLAARYGLQVAAGHGLTYRNVGAVARIEEIIEFNIGHNIISRAVMVGLDQAVREMLEAIKRR